MSPEFEELDLARSAFRVGEWLVQPSLNRLVRGETTVQLELKVMDVLVCLAGRPGEVVSRSELTDTVWATEFISDNTVSHAVADLRSALGDDAKQPRYVETIQRRGYRLIAAVESVAPKDAGPSEVARFPSPAGSAPASDGRSPYPGMSAFTEEDAENFFGREAEVARMWRRLTSRRLLAVIGPSGVGKSSFLRAGVIPARPEGWGAVVCQPGERPIGSLAPALLPEFAGDIEATAQLVDLRDADRAVAVVSRWRGRFQQALLVVDQFEELFTHNPSEAQAAFAGLLRKLVDDADVHVVLAMRDDFLCRCQGLKPLQPVFDGLLPLEQPDPESLRRALVEPAGRHGYAFEDDQLPREMVAEVEGERGALPMLAFAVARLWEKRDRETGLLTRQAYHEIGGVGGALARHAEATVDRIGHERLPIVREIFRNLVTAEGTRAVREWDELLSVFDGESVSLSSRASEGPKGRRESRDPPNPGATMRKGAPSRPSGDPSIRSSDSLTRDDRRGAAEEVLHALIDARLLTSYEVKEEDAEPTRRVEIIHESLLANWPRLVRWQTQDADAAQLRDQLRQAARTWDEHGRTVDYLWAGKAFREFTLWKESYAGGLSDVEMAFANAMTSLATRRRRRRRIASVAALVVFALIGAVFAALWRRSVQQERRAEAANLVSLGQLELESYPTSAVAHAIASLELADTRAARLLAVEALWKGPTAFSINEESCQFASFSEQGDRLLQRLNFDPRLRVISEDGSSFSMDQVHGSDQIWLQISPSGELICSMDRGTADDPARIVVWSMEQKHPLATMEVESPSKLATWRCWDAGALVLLREGEAGHVEILGPDGSHRRLGAVDLDLSARGTLIRLEAHSIGEGGLLAVFGDGALSLVDIEEDTLSEPRLVRRVEPPLTGLAIDPMRRFIATSDATGRIDLLDPVDGSVVHTLDGPRGTRTWVRFVDDGSLLEAMSVDSDSVGQSWIWSFESAVPQLTHRVHLGLLGTGGWGWDSVHRQAVKAGPDLKTRLWRSEGPIDAEPLELMRGTTGILWMPEFHPTGTWIAVPSNVGLAMWPLARSYSFILRHHTKVVYGLAFSPDGGWIASSSMDFTVRLWPLVGTPPPSGRVLLGLDDQAQKLDLAVSPDGEQLLVGAGWSDAQMVNVNGGPPRVLDGFDSQVWSVAFSPSGRLAAAVGGEWEPRERVVRVWNVASGDEIAVLGPEEGLRPMGLEFLDEHHLLTGGDSGLRRWDLRTGESERLQGGANMVFAVDESRRRVLFTEGNEGNISAGHEAVVLDLDTGVTRPLGSHGDRIRSVAVDSAGGVVVTGDVDGVIRVGSVTGDEPHLLLGHQRSVEAVAVDPLGRWIASGSEDTTVRLWPMPDLSKPPLHTLPREELIARLKTLTNLRAVRDPDSATGWTLTLDPFPGWETVPTW